MQHMTEPYQALTHYTDATACSSAYARAAYKDN